MRASLTQTESRGRWQRPEDVRRRGADCTRPQSAGPQCAAAQGAGPQGAGAQGAGPQTGRHPVTTGAEHAGAGPQSTGVKGAGPQGAAPLPPLPPLPYIGQTIATPIALPKGVEPAVEEEEEAVVMKPSGSRPRRRRATTGDLACNGAAHDAAGGNNGDDVGRDNETAKMQAVISALTLPLTLPPGIPPGIAAPSFKRQRSATTVNPPGDRCDAPSPRAIECRGAGCARLRLRSPGWLRSPAC